MLRHRRRGRVDRRPPCRRAPRRTPGGRCDRPGRAGPAPPTTCPPPRPPPPRGPRPPPDDALPTAPVARPAWARRGAPTPPDVPLAASRPRTKRTVADERAARNGAPPAHAAVQHPPVLYHGPSLAEVRR